MDYSYNYLLRWAQAAAAVEFAPALRQSLLRQEEPASVELVLELRQALHAPRERWEPQVKYFLLQQQKKIFLLQKQL
jgi:hypothetical protein